MTGVFSDRLRAAINGESDKPIKPRVVAHGEVLDTLLASLTRIDFRALSGIAEEAKPSRTQQRVLVVKEVLEAAQKLNLGLCRQHDFLYCYNGEFWSIIDENEMQSFLGECAFRCGVSEITSKDFKFRQDLFQQFLALATPPKPRRRKGLVLLNLKNGTLEISAKRVFLRPFDRNDFLTYQLEFDYNPLAKAPVFERFLSEALPDSSAQNILAEYLGYIFTHGLKLEKILILYGSGANGKSVVFDIVTALVGTANVSNYSLQSLTDNNGYSRAMLSTKLLNYASEVSGKLESSTFKLLASGEPVECRLPYGRPFLSTDYGKLIFNCNELPTDTEQTEAFFRRFLILPFLHTVPLEKRDPTLSKRIIESEMSGVLNWVLAGLGRLLKNQRFSKCELAEKMLERFRTESDSVLLFLEEENYQKSHEYHTPLQDLYSNYQTFCVTNRYIPLSNKKFVKRLEAADYQMTKRNTGKIVYVTNSS